MAWCKRFGRSLALTRHAGMAPVRVLRVGLGPRALHPRVGCGRGLCIRRVSRCEV